MKSKFIYFFGIFLIAFSAPALQAGAQEAASSSEAWTLDRCLDYAMANNLDIRQKQVSVEQSKIDIKARQGALFPSLSFVTNQNGSWRPWSSSYVNITDGSMASTTSTLNYNGSYGLQAQWTVWNGGINYKRLKRSQLALEQTEVDEEIEKVSVRQQIVELYTQILYQTEGVEVCKQMLESTRTQLNQARQFYEVGRMSKADLAQVEAQVSQEEYNVTNAETQLAQFKLQLRQLLEIPADMDFSVATPAIDDASVTSPLPAVAEVYASAQSWRPELKYSRMGIELADMDINIAKRGYYPTISLMAGINTSASSGLESSWAKQIKTNLSNSLGLTLSVPIFDNRQNSTNVAKARLDKENAEINLERQQRQVYNEIETYWLNATNSGQEFVAARSNVAGMEESYNLVSEQFAVGLKDIVDLTTAKSNLLQAKQQLLQAKYTACLNRMLLNYYRGESLTY